jgi:hypothetical protein
MTRIVRTAYRYKRPPRKRKPVALEVPAVVMATDPAKPRQRLVAAPERPHDPAPAASERKPTIVTIRDRKLAAIPAGLLADTPEHVGACLEFPSLSHLANDPEAAPRGVRKRVADVIADMLTNKEPIP